MDIKSVIASVLVAALVSAGVVGLSKPEAVENTLGAITGPDVTSYLNVMGWFGQGGTISTVSPVDATHTLTYAEMAEASVITFVASTTMPALTATLPASTTFPLPVDRGARRSWVIENPFTAAATTTTIAAGTGINLQEPDGQNVVIGINNYAWITCVRGADSGAPLDIVCSIDETIPG